MAVDTPLFPVGLLMAGRRSLVVGGGRVAGRKAAALLACQAIVTMVAPEVAEGIEVLTRAGALEGIEGPPLDVQIRPYRRGEAAEYRLVVTATGNLEVDRAVAEDAEAAGVWVNVADDSTMSTALLPAVHRDGQVTLTVATGGSSPALATWLRRKVAEALGPGLGQLASVLEEGRHRVHDRGGTTEDVDWTGLLDGPLPHLVNEGRIEEARALVIEAVDSAQSR